jgi:hypothetical protein
MKMKIWVLGLALITAGASGAAMAADLEGPAPQYGSAYDDSRYADVYRYPPPRPAYQAPAYRAPAYGDDDDADIYQAPQRFSYDGRHPPYGACVPREQVRYRLTSAGWYDFHDGALRGEVATVHARRPNGRLFELTINRCSGDVVEARPLEPRRAWGPFARRWGRAY